MFILIVNDLRDRPPPHREDSGSAHYRGFTGSDWEQGAVVRVIERLAQRRGGVDRAAHTSESRRLTPAHLWA